MSFQAYINDYERRHGPVVDHTDYNSSTGGVERDVREREELAFRILASLPRSSLAVLQHRIEPLLKLDIVALLPTEVALEVFSYLPYQTLLTCALVCRRWRALANHQSLWRSLCIERKWEWRVQPDSKTNENDSAGHPVEHADSDLDDEGMGDEEDDGFTSTDNDTTRAALHSIPSIPTTAHLSLLVNSSHTLPNLHHGLGAIDRMRSPRERHSAPSIMRTSAVQENALAPVPNPDSKPDYKLLHQTHIKLKHRFTTGQYTLSNLQTRGAPNGHTNTIYCVQLYTYAETGTQVLFTGSKDRTVREWDLQTGAVIRVLEGVHESSVLSICVHRGLLASASSDRRVVVWDLAQSQVIRAIRDHEDSVLCVRFDDKRLVSCSKDRTVRTYLFPRLEQQHVLSAHRAAVNAVSIASKYIISVSGDRSLRLWDADTGVCLRTFENHHRRGIASIDYKHPFVLSGSSDKHIRVLDVSTLQGWSTNPAVTDKPAAAAGGLGRAVPMICESCGGSTSGEPVQPRRRAHEDLVRSVALSSDLVVSGSYDFTVKVWDRKTGALVADLAGGHTGRIFCVGFDCTKIVSCGEDQRICIWDFSHGIDTSFLTL